MSTGDERAAIARQLFSLLDDDGDGIITFDEFRMAYDEYPVEMIRFFGPDDAQSLVAEATDTFARHDHDGVGYLTTAYVGVLVERHVRTGPKKIPFQTDTLRMALL